MMTVLMLLQAVATDAARSGVDVAQDLALLAWKYGSAALVGWVASNTNFSKKLEAAEKRLEKTIADAAEAHGKRITILEHELFGVHGDSGIRVCVDELVADAEEAKLWRATATATLKRVESMISKSLHS